MQSLTRISYLIFCLKIFFGVNCTYAATVYPEISITQSISFVDPKPEGDFTKLTIPLKRVQNLFFIEAKVDTLVGNFILDTGAPNLVLNKTYFNQWRVAEGVASFGITGGGNQVYYKHLDSLVIDKLSYQSLDADLVDLGHLENSRGIKILGLLGANLFFEMEMEIDMQNSVLYLYKLDKAGNRLEDIISLTPDLEVPIVIENNIMFMQATVGEKKLRFCLDTGAESNALNNNSSNKVLQHFALTGRTKLGGSGYQTMEVLNGVLDEIYISEYAFRDMPFILSDISYLQTVYATNLNGVIGYPFFAKGKVIINTKKNLLSMYFYTSEQE